MNLTKKKSEPEVVVTDDAPVKAGGKNAPTPRRNAARAARKQQLKGTPATKKEARAAIRDAQAHARQSLKSTNVEDLPAPERMKEKVYARDLVDSRFSAIGLIIPVAVIYFLVSTAFSRVPVIQTSLLFLALAIFILMVLDGIWMSRRIEARVRARHPESVVPLRMYAFRRATSLKRWRRPVVRDVPPANHWKARG